MSVKLICLNVSLFDDNNKKLSQFLEKEKPDIVCLQEVSRKVDENADDTYISKDPIDEALPKLPYSFFAPNWALKDFWQKNFHGKELFQHNFGGVIEYGNYTKSTYPKTLEKGVFVQKNFSHITDWEEFAAHPGEEPRIESQKVRILNYHGIWSKDKKGTARTEAASKLLLKLASEVTYPVIICGDFNLFPDTKSIAMLDKQFINLVDEYNISHTRPQSRPPATGCGI